MTKSTFKADVEDRVLDLVWSLWAEAGVSGWERRHRDSALDIEALLVFSTFISTRDPRLRSEVADWCLLNEKLISRSRLRNLIRVQRDFLADGQEFDQELVEMTRPTWPKSLRESKIPLSGKAEHPELGRPALIQARYRAVFGATARAELIKVFAANPGAAFTAADLAHEVSYGKRNVAEALDGFRSAGLLSAIPVRNHLKYRPTVISSVIERLGEVPTVFPRWPELLRIAAVVLLNIEKLDELNEPAKSVEATKVMAWIEDEAKAAQVPTPVMQFDERTPWMKFQEWTLQFLEALSSEERSLSDLSVA
jgi:hypothetical protein